MVTQYIHDESGKLARKVVGGEQYGTVYIGGIYEKNLDTGTVIKYYYADGKRVAMRLGPTPYHIVEDHLGGTAATQIVMLNSPGSWRAARYYPYGMVRTTGTLPPTDKLYTGQQRETANGIYHYGARFYNADIGRFVQADSIVPEAGNPQALNRYSYVYNNPLKFGDPSGHKPLDMDECWKNGKITCGGGGVGGGGGGGGGSAGGGGGGGGGAPDFPIALPRCCGGSQPGDSGWGLIKKGFSLFPGTGEGNDILTAITGHDHLWGEDVAWWERALVLCSIPASGKTCRLGIDEGSGGLARLISNSGAAPKLPPFNGKTHGVLRTVDEDIPLESGAKGPAKTMPGGRGTGFDPYTRTHVEGHAAATMRQQGIQEATLYINHPDGLCTNCARNLPNMLPPGSQLTIVSPVGVSVFTGRGP